MKHFFVINPHSFCLTGNMEQVIAEIRAAIPVSSQMDYEIYISRYPRDAIAAVHRYISLFLPEETVRVYAVGGDGILFDCLNGMADFPNAELTSIPYGTANDVVRAYGENAKVQFRDIGKLFEAKAHLVDIIRCGANYALNEVSLGLSGQCVLHANAILRNKRSKFYTRFVSQIYFISSVRAVLTKEVMNQRYRIFAGDEDLSGRYCNINISNGPCNGGTKVPSPYARPNDGLLDVILVSSDKMLKILGCMADFQKGLFEKHTVFTRRQCREIELESSVPIRVHIDGDAFFAERLKIELLPGYIKFFVPEGLDFADYSQLAYKKTAKKKTRNEN
ncbi:MAG: hypothetical protein LBC99_06865 [Spirochaetota bacterium]|jgi:diacylglycerol kinase family enzyme|nr:hypothetical protein [Spirochaetota bacterium]